ncbi:hypothetical protein L7F22_016912, partial [Adiantum nelumboides]|nr:hypothetical protein [Adiantum nelumboides]
MCDARTAYNYQFIVYDKLPKSNGLGLTMVQDLVKCLPHKGHYIYLDRGFTSFKLLQWLSNNGFGATGTIVVSKNSKTWPKTDVWLEKNVPRGTTQFAYCRKTGLFACAWQDAKPVFATSNVWGMGSTTCKRQVGSARTIVRCPEALVQYNTNKAGCDTFDQMCLASSYSVEESMISFKWWHKAFWGMLDVVYTNSYIIFKHWHKEISHHEFLVDLQALLVANSYGSDYVTRSMRSIGEEKSAGVGNHMSIK